MMMARSSLLKGICSFCYRRSVLSVPFFRSLFLGFLLFVPCQVAARESAVIYSDFSSFRTAQVDDEIRPDSGSSPVSQLFVKLTELEGLVQSLTGRLEELQHENMQLQKLLKLHIEDSGVRLRELEEKRSVSPDGMSSGQLTPTPRKGLKKNGEGSSLKLPEGSPEDQYRYAFGLLRDSKYEGARGALKMFIDRHPKHSLAGNAQYWIGETFYVREDFKKAAVAFLDGYKKYPKNTKAPDNLLKLALSMARLGKDKKACVSLRKLANEYPQASDAIKRRVSMERSRLQCL